VMLRSLQGTFLQGTHDIIRKNFCTTHGHKIYNSSGGREHRQKRVIFPLYCPGIA
jgi:hypothetical protein